MQARGGSQGFLAPVPAVPFSVNPCARRVRLICAVPGFCFVILVGESGEQLFKKLRALCYGDSDQRALEIVQSTRRAARPAVRIGAALEITLACLCLIVSRRAAC